MTEALRDILGLENLAADIAALHFEAGCAFLHSSFCCLFEFGKRLDTIACLVPACAGHAAHPFQLLAVEVARAGNGGVDGIHALFTFL